MSRAGREPAAEFRFSNRCAFKFMGAVLCVYETTRARLPREFIDSRGTASFGRCSVLSSLLPLFWLTVAPVSCLRGCFVKSNDVPLPHRRRKVCSYAARARVCRRKYFSRATRYTLTLSWKPTPEGWKVVSSLVFQVVFARFRYRRRDV